MATANNTRIEETAITSLKAVLLRCPILMPYISSNDKTPAWDGTVFVYKNDKHTNDNLLGRVPIQVKGTEKEFIGKTVKYSCRVSDLQRYYNDGGCMFFLLCVKPETGVAEIHYSAMLVYDLKKLLDHSKRKKTLTISLNRFPTEDPREIAATFTNFTDNYLKQASFIGKEFPSLDQLEKQGTDIDFLTFTTSGIGFNALDIEDYVSKHDIYLYAKPKGIDIEIPVDKISNALVARRINAKVSIAGVEQYKHYYIISQNGQSAIKLGEGITFVYDKTKQAFLFHYEPTGTLSDCIRDVEFYLSLAEHKSISINGSITLFEGLADFDINKAKENLQIIKDAKRMLEYLGVNEELLCDNLSKMDAFAIQYLTQAILYKRSIKLPNSKENVLYGAYKIANLSIWLWADRQEDGSYQIENFFLPHQLLVFDESDITHSYPIPAPHVLLLNRDAFVHTSNMDYGFVAKCVCETEYHPALFDGTIALLLDMLRAYDEQSKKDERLLELADKVCDWLAKNGEKTDVSLIRINKLQIIKRKRELSFQEKCELTRYLETTNNTVMRCGAFLLLDEDAEAQKCFAELSQEDQIEFLSYPICHFGSLRIPEKNSKNNPTKTNLAGDK